MNEQLATGVTPGVSGGSVGIEHIDDIIADIERALNPIESISFLGTTKVLNIQKKGGLINIWSK